MIHLATMRAVRNALRLGSLIAFAVALPGQAPPKDVDGWGKIKWGATIAEARAAYNIVTPTEKTDTSLEMQVDVGTISMSAALGDRHGSGRITQVVLFMSFGLPKDVPRAGPEDFDTLKSLLTQKYGVPVGDETTRNVNTRDRTVLWTFPSTSIVLTLSQYETRLGSITLRYREADKKALDAL